ncbi:tRNA (adenosine(37)-N6)-threonylcarbamoyltransferase complex ATPase subunit type 1 TsaE, partial [Streptococcus pyogenes]
MILPNEPATAQAGATLASMLRPGDVVTLSGPLGVGKTSFARAVLHAAGHEGEVPSPTFAIVQPYD